MPKPPRAGPERGGRAGRGAAALLLAVLAPAAWAGAADAGAARLPMTDRGPLTGVIGLPDGWTGAAMPAVEFAFALANNAVRQDGGTESLLFDGETHVLQLRARHRIGERLSLGLEVPWISHGGGFMDRFIDGWHDAFGLDPGIRPRLPSGDLQYVHARGGQEAVALRDYAAGLGDVTTSAALALAGTDPAAGQPLVELTADVQWGTGDADELTGSGSTDVAAGLSVTAPAAGGRRFGWSARGGLLWPGAVDRPLPAAAGQVWYYEGSVSWRLVPSLDLVLQALGHSGAWQSDLKMLGGRSLQLGAGGTWRCTDHYGLRLAVLEDLRVDTAPDFGLELAVVYRP